jgi:flagellar hook-associated protein 1 FlgK
MSLFNVGISGLLASQSALTTVGHNVANVNTPGYTRQRVELATRAAQLTAGGYIGKGVTVEDIRRSYDGLLTSQVRIGTSNVAENRAFNALAVQVDNLMADPANGLASALQGFFDAVHASADDPSSLAARQVVLSEGETLVERFHTLDRRLADLRRGHAQQLRDAVDEVNDLASAIAGLNHDIQLAVGQGGGSQPNDLLDQRDELLRQMSDLVGIDVLEQGDGTINVFVGTGQALVVGTRTQQLSVVNSSFDPSRLEVAYDTGAGPVEISGILKGGELAGLLQFRDQMLDPAQNALGRVAIGLADTFNDQHQLGADLYGNLGQAFFSTLDATSPVVFADAANTGAPPAVINATVTDVNALTTSDYRLERTAAGYTLTRLSDGQTTSVPGFAGGAPASVALDGLTLDWVSDNIAVGDRFLIQPTRLAARDIDLQISNAEEIAAAAPIRTAAGLANTGTGQVSAGTVDGPPPADPNLLEPVTITFTAAGTFDVSGTGTGDPVGVAYTPGGDISYNGWTIQITGTPAAGDSFTVQPNTTGVGDNRNALLLAALQDTPTLAGGKATYEEAYGQMVTAVGSKTRQSEINLGAQEVMLEQATAARDAVSGVNLDEAAAHLVQFQQAYQASAQVIGAADAVFQSLLDAVGR